MRELKGRDMYVISEIIDRAGITVPALTREKRGKTGEFIEVAKSDEEIGIEITLDLVKKIHKVKGILNPLLEDVFEIKSLDEQPLPKIIKLVKELMKSVDIKSFL